MVQKGAVESPAYRFVSPERKGNVRDTAADFTPGAKPLDFSRCANEVNRVVVVLRQARSHRQDVGVKDDVVGGNPYFLHQNTEGSLTDIHLVFEVCRLTVLVKGHHNHRGPMPLADLCAALEILLAFLERDRIHNALALGTLEARFHHVEFGRIDHEGNLAHIRLGDQEVDEFGHGRNSIDEAIVHVDVQNIRTLLHLLPCYCQGLLVVSIHDGLLVHYGASNIAPLPNVQKGLTRTGWIGGVIEGLKATQAHLGLHSGDLPWREPLGQVRNLTNVLGRRATAAAKHVHNPLFQKRTQLFTHLLACLVIPAHAVR
mmetsp:Transcript_14896/g.37859  ORF Transcript_14896/g.37859 Transcript_14896/m.37859 type:complete len:315 (-) Transcript_14896:627-1571(-)